MKKLINFFKEEDGATAVEYGILVALIAAVIIITVVAVGQRVETGFNDVVQELGEVQD